MRLEELVGKKAVRTQSVWHNDDNIAVDVDGMDPEYRERHYSEDDSFKENDYITILAVTEEGVEFRNHNYAGKGITKDDIIRYDERYDQGFLDNNWEEYKGEE